MFYSWYAFYVLEYNSQFSSHCSTSPQTIPQNVLSFQQHWISNLRSVKLCSLLFHYVNVLPSTICLLIYPCCYDLPMIWIICFEIAILITSDSFYLTILNCPTKMNSQFMEIILTCVLYFACGFSYISYLFL
jgi:hypothetical protein